MSIVSRVSGLSNIIQRRIQFKIFRGAERMFSGTNIANQQNKVQQQKDLNLYTPSKKEKQMLVDAKIYESIESIPETVSSAKVFKAKEWWRVRISIMMLSGTILCCVMVVIMGKRAQRSIRLDKEEELKQNRTET